MRWLSILALMLLPLIRLLDLIEDTVKGTYR